MGIINENHFSHLPLSFIDPQAFQREFLDTNDTFPTNLNRTWTHHTVWMPGALNWMRWLKHLIWVSSGVSHFEGVRFCALVRSSFDIAPLPTKNIVYQPLPNHILGHKQECDAWNINWVFYSIALKHRVVGNHSYLRFCDILRNAPSYIF